MGQTPETIPVPIQDAPMTRGFPFFAQFDRILDKSCIMLGQSRTCLFIIHFPSMQAADGAINAV